MLEDDPVNDTAASSSSVNNTNTIVINANPVNTVVVGGSTASTVVDQTGIIFFFPFFQMFTTEKFHL